MKDLHKTKAREYKSTDSIDIYDVIYDFHFK